MGDWEIGCYASYSGERSTPIDSTAMFGVALGLVWVELLLGCWVGFMFG